MFAVKSRVFDPLDRLLQLFQSPSKLIEKRQDKCLDYDRMLNRAQKNKDADKNRQVSQVNFETELSEFSCSLKMF